MAGSPGPATAAGRAKGRLFRGNEKATALLPFAFAGLEGTCPGAVHAHADEMDAGEVRSEQKASFVGYHLSFPFSFTRLI